MAVGIVKAKGYDIKLADRSIIEAMFTDYEGISEVAKDYVAIAVENKLISGYSDDTFRAQRPVTRAEACALLWRAFMYGNENKVIPDDENSITGDKQSDNPSTASDSSSESTDNKLQKYRVETIVGGNGFGQVDGKGNEAKIGKVWSMALDKNDNVYFLDNLMDYAGTGSYSEDALGEEYYDNEQEHGAHLIVTNENCILTKKPNLIRNLLPVFLQLHAL